MAHAKKMLNGYIKNHCCLFFVGFLFNILGMVGEFVTPLFIGVIIDHIIDKDFDSVTDSVLIWCCFNVGGSLIQGCQKYLFAMLTE